MQRVKRALEMRRARERQLFRRRYSFEIVLRAVEMGLVSVGVPARTRIGRNFDLRKTLFCLLHRRFVVVRIDQELKVGRHVLPLLGQHIVDVRIHPVVRIAHRLLPQSLLVGRQCGGFALGAVDGGEMHQQITEQVQHAAGIFLAKAPQRSIGAARVERERSLSDAADFAAPRTTVRRRSRKCRPSRHCRRTMAAARSIR